MGEQSAALLAAGHLGVVPPPWLPALTVRLGGPPGWDLDRVARSHGASGLPPTAYDGVRLHTVLPDGTRAVVHPDLAVDLSRQSDLAPLRRVLDLDRDLGAFHDAVDDLLPWARAHGAGRLLRAATPFQALTQALAATNTSYAGTQAMLAALVRCSPTGFPCPDLTAEPAGWGYRLPALLQLCSTDLDGLEDLHDAALHAAVLALRGFGPFAAASALALLGRPRPLVLDGWLRRQVADISPYAALGRWGGTALWVDVSERWLYRSVGGT